MMLAPIVGWQSCLHAENGPLVERAKEEAKASAIISF